MRDTRYRMRDVGYEIQDAGYRMWDTGCVNYSMLFSNVKIFAKTRVNSLIMNK